MLNFPRWKQAAIIITCLVGLFMVLPNFLSQQALDKWPRWLPKGQLSLGLDLRGGAHLLYAMELDDVRKDWLDSLRDDARRRLRDAKIAVSAVGISGQTVQVRLARPEDADAALKALRQMIQPLGNPLMGGSGTDIDVQKEGADTFTIAPTEAGLKHRIGNAVDAAIETVRRRVDAVGTKEPHIVREGEGRILVQVPGLQDTAELERLIGETARLSFHEVHPSVTPAEAKAGRVPVGFKIYQGADKREGEYLLRETPVVRGDELSDAGPGFHPQTTQPIVHLSFNNSGARKFGKFTRDHVGKPFAIVLDDKVISAPEIRSAIEGGSGYIEGNFTPETSTKLAIQLRSGALPAKLTIAEKRTVGPSLGNDSIEAGKLAGVIGGLATIVLTILYYGTFGIFACIGLVVHGALTVALMSLFGSALTLPGIAGLVLGIAMAVDANVLIYERIREEVRNGKSPVAAIDAGFTRAFVTIADSQLTTLACAIVMFWLGAGPIRGFAVTLTIGICTSIFASVTVVRLLIYYWLNAQPRGKGTRLALPV
ncbi:MAG TPA: protein translocase subunit SecD [Hyphomicrobiaceae bacterium]|nr:protein translocase subunit SecD [Hyphomicrobiaceae bacterium]